jgi:hypothetical protein
MDFASLIQSSINSEPNYVAAAVIFCLVFAFLALRNTLCTILYSEKKENAAILNPYDVFKRSKENVKGERDSDHWA